MLIALIQHIEAKRQIVNNYQVGAAVPMKYDDLFDSFVISLKRQPEKLQAFLDRNAPSRIHFQHYEATDGEECGPITNYTAGAVGNAMSHLALWQRCIEQAKPLAVFEDDAVIRHDIKPRLPPLVAQEIGWDIILFGYNTDVSFELKIVPGIDFHGKFSVAYPTAQQLANFASENGAIGLQRLAFALGCCGYAITPKCAEVLIRSCFPLDNRPVVYRSVHHPFASVHSITRSFPAYGIDCLMATIFPNLLAYACLPPLVMSANDRKTSTTIR